MNYNTLQTYCIVVKLFKLSAINRYFSHDLLNVHCIEKVSQNIVDLNEIHKFRVIVLFNGPFLKRDESFVIDIHIVYINTASIQMKMNLLDNCQ
jgi:hypothetical protein